MGESIRLTSSTEKPWVEVVDHPFADFLVAIMSGSAMASIRS